MPYTGSVLFVDDVPVLFAGARDEDVDFHRALARRIGSRARQGEWDGDYPLTGGTLLQSLLLCDQLVAPLLRAAGFTTG